jgi:hypothetical protein
MTVLSRRSVLAPINLFAGPTTVLVSRYGAKPKALWSKRRYPHDYDHRPTTLLFCIPVTLFSAQHLLEQTKLLSCIGNPAKMKSHQVALVASGLFVFPYHVVASRAEVSRNHISKRETVPNGPYDPATISTCTFWYGNFEGKSCKVVRDWMFAISAEDFARWNPSVTVDCGNWQELSYCVQVKSEQTSTTRSSVVTRTTTSTTTSVSATPTLDSWESLGCYVDSNTLHNRTTKVSGSQLTIEGCESSCWSDSFLYAGVKGGNECWCGSFVGNGWTEDQGDCSLPCGGDASEVCGGSSVFNVFGAKTVDDLPAATATWFRGTKIPSTSATSTSTTKTSTTATPTSAMAAATHDGSGGNTTVKTQESGSGKTSIISGQMWFLLFMALYKDLCM